MLHEAFRRGWPAVSSLVPPRVKQEVERYLGCGDVRYGFVEVSCPNCHDCRLVALAYQSKCTSGAPAAASAGFSYMECERRRQADHLQVDQSVRARIIALATDVPRLWNEPKTPQRERKSIVRLLIEDATLLKNDTGITMHVRFKGGATRSLTLPAPQPSWRLSQTNAEVVEEIDRLLNQHTCGEVAALLNARGILSGTGRSFHADRVQYLCKAYSLKPRLQRLREAGLLTLEELAAKLGRSPGTIKLWRNSGRLPVAARKLNDDGQYNAGRVLTKKCRALAGRLDLAATAFERELGPSDISFAGKGAVARMTLAFGIKTQNKAALQDAARLFGLLHKIAAELQWNHLSTSALSAQADALRYLDHFREAIAAYSDVLSLAAKFGLPKAAADAKFNLAIVLHESGQFEEACAKMSEAQTDYSRIGDGDSAEDARKSPPLCELSDGGRRESLRSPEHALEQQPAARRVAAVEAELELVEVGRQMLVGDAPVERAEHRALEEREELVDGRQHLHGPLAVFPDDVLLVTDADLRQALVGSESIGGRYGAVGVSVWLR